MQVLRGNSDELPKINYGAALGLGTDVVLSDKSIISFNVRYSMDANYNKMSGYVRNGKNIVYQNSYKFTGRSFEFLIGFEFK